ncbi:MAG: META domain-containing protein [Cyclobacteriaceae bacterium]|nr:META domain-containing protein [Cyclobacteriaceae bacterium]
MKNFLPAVLLMVVALINCQTQKLSLTDVEWKLTSLNGKDYATAEPITLTFTGDNKVAGHAGCNRYFGSYTHSGSVISFGNLGATKMYCDGKMETEDAFMKALAEVDGYSLSTEKLQLKAGETTILEFIQ